MKKKLNINVILIGLVVVLIAGVLLFSKMGKTEGAMAQVHIETTGEVMEISLEEDGIYEIPDARIPVTLQVKDGAIAFVNSVCPDHTCEGNGFLRMEDDISICLPAGVAVIVVG